MLISLQDTHQNSRFKPLSTPYPYLPRPTARKWRYGLKTGPQWGVFSLTGTGFWGSGSLDGQTPPRLMARLPGCHDVTGSTFHI